MFCAFPRQADQQKTAPDYSGSAVHASHSAFCPPGAWFGSLVSLLRLDYPFAAYALSPLILAAVLAFGYCMRIAARTLAAASRRTVPRFVYGLAALCFFGLTVVLVPLTYAYSHASGNAAVSVTFGFLAFY
jgi:hypothetical protein